MKSFIRLNQFILWASLSLLVWCCQTQPVKESVNDLQGKFPIKQSLQLKKSHTFSLDTLTSAFNWSLQIFTQGAKEYLTVLNEDAQLLYFYDVSSGKTVLKIPLSKEGPNGIGRATGHFVHTMDSIFVYDYGTSVLSIVDSTGKLLKKYLVFDNGINGQKVKHAQSEAKYTPAPEISALNPLVVLGQEAYMTGCVSGEFQDENEKNRPFRLKLDLQTGIVEYGDAYPPEYQNANWLGYNLFRIPYQTYNAQKEMFVYSFPVVHHLIVSDKQHQKSEPYYAGSRHISKIISSSKLKSFHDMHYEAVFYTLSPSYSAIIWDRYRDCYYRFAQIPLENPDMNNLKRRLKKDAIIILDKDLNYMGETVLPYMQYDVRHCYLSKDGLGLLRRTKENEDQMIFDVFVSEKMNQ